MLWMTARFKIALLFLLLLGGASALAQNGQIAGQVTDQQGAAIPGAAVQVISQESTIKRDAKTDNVGSYAVRYLPPGQYQVIIQANGFGSTASPLLSLTTSQELVFNAQLTIAAAKAEVTVSAGVASVEVELDTATISTTLSNKEVESYGLNGRNFSQLITMAPGVSNQTGQDEAKVGVAGSAKFSVNGGRVEYNTFEVDGSDVLNTSINASRGQGEPLIVYPSVDAIQDMKVLTSNYSAVYGKSASGSVLVTTKSGASVYHGNAYEFLRNEMFNARNYFDQPTEDANGNEVKRTPLYRRQDFGITLGGPLYIPGRYNAKKDKTFFFVSEEVRLEKTPVAYNQAVPTMAERGQGTKYPGLGDFSDVCPTAVPGGSPYFKPSAYPDCPYKKLEDAGDQEGQHYPNPVVIPSYTGRAILNTGIIPEPNSNTGCNTTNPTALLRCYDASVSPPTFWREELFRLDHNLTHTQQISFRYIHDTWRTTTLTPQWGIVQNSFPTVENRLTGPGLDMVLNLAQTLPHGFLNRITASYSVEHITLKPQAGAGMTSMQRPALLGFNNQKGVAAAGWTQLDDNASCGTTQSTSGPAQTITGCAMGYIFDNGFGGNKMPGLRFQGSNGAYGGHGFSADTGYAPWNQANPTYDLRDDGNKVIGKHNLQFGFEAAYIQQNELSAVSGANSGDQQGLLTFSDQQSLYTSGNAFADFLAGPGFTPYANGYDINSDNSYNQTGIKSYTQDSGQAKYYNRYKMAEMYLQDDWRVNSHLTLSFGFRASLFGTWYNPQGTAYNWTPKAYSTNLGSTIGVDTNYGYLYWATGASPGTPVPLGSGAESRTGPYSLANLPDVVTNGLTQCGGNSGTPASCMKGSVFHPAPRAGFSWDPWGDGKTAIRGGYGLFWEHGTGYEANTGSLIGSAPLILSETQSNVPFSGSSSSSSSIGAYNAIGLSCQGGTEQCGNLNNPANGATFPLNVTSIPNKAVYSYTQQWSLSVQRELQKNTVVQIAYVGAKGTHLTAVRDLNQLPPASPNPFLPGQPITADVCGSGATYVYFSDAGTNSSATPTWPISNTAGIGSTTPGYKNMLVACTGNPGFYYGSTKGQTGKLLGLSADDMRPYPGFSNIISVANVADSQYHALQATLREVTGPLTVGVAYTYSHSLDDSSDRASANFANSLDIRSNRASSDFDQRHMLNISYLYELPFRHLLQGFGNLLGANADVNGEPAPSASGGQQTRLLKTLLSGWQLSGITTWQTGTPFSVVNGGGSNGTGPADNAGVGDGLGIGSYVDKVGDAHGPKPTVSSGSNIGPLLLNPGAYVAPQGLTFGNSGRNSLNNPSRINFNMSLLKTFKIPGDRVNFEFRTEAYNVFNHTQFRIYDPSHPGNTGNNVVNCYGDITTGYSAAGGGGTDCLTGNSFLHPVDAHDPRILQFGLKMAF